MTKTISFELSKRLDKLGLLRDVETEYCYMYNILGDAIIHKYNNNLGGKKYKTLTTDEAIEFLINYKIGFGKSGGREEYIVAMPGIIFQGKTILQAIEKMITYLLDNNLIGKLK